MAIPPLIDVRDALDRAEAASTGNLDDDLEPVRERIAAVADDEVANVPSTVAALDDRILALRDRRDLSEGADYWLETVHNRFSTYRDRLDETSAALEVASARIVDGDDERASVAEVDDAEATLRGTLVNGGSATRAVVQVVFYDDDGAPLWKVESPAVDLDTGERRPVDRRVYVPEAAAYWDAVPLETVDTRTVEGHLG